MNETVTKKPTGTELQRLGMDALDKQAAGAISMARRFGGLNVEKVLEVMEFAKLMAVSDWGVPPHCRGNPGGCLMIVSKAIAWDMEPYAVADKSYIVKGRLGWESQLVHAVIEARVPLQHRLDAKFDGEGGERTCTIIGMFTNGDVREYTSPKIATLIPAKNQDGELKGSPLWGKDPDQQLFYYSSRAWARRWCPEVIMGVYTKEELRAEPRIGRDDADEDNETTGLANRLGKIKKSAEGHDADHVERELAQLAPAGQTIDHDENNPPVVEAGASPVVSDMQIVADSPKDAKRTSKPRKGKAKIEAEPVAEVAETQPLAPPVTTATKPKTVREYEIYCAEWIRAEPDSAEIQMRWAKERSMRNNIGMTSEQRLPLEAFMIDRIEKLRGSK